MNMNALPSERTAILAAVAPVNQAAGAVSTAWVSMAEYHQLLAVVAVGVLGTAATVDAKIEQAKTSGGTGAKDVTGKAIAQLVKATDDGKQALINVNQEDLDVDNGYAYVRLTLTVGTAASQISGVLLGFDPRNQPVTQATTVKETVN